MLWPIKHFKKPVCRIKVKISSQISPTTAKLGIPFCSDTLLYPLTSLKFLKNYLTPLMLTRIIFSVTAYVRVKG